jgi:hypothetical protein
MPNQEPQMPEYRVSFTTERQVFDGSDLTAERTQGTAQLSAPDALAAAREMQRRAEQLKCDMQVVDVQLVRGD